MKSSLFKIVASVAVVLVFIEAMFVVGWFLGAGDSRVLIFDFENGSEDVVTFSTNKYAQSLYDWGYDEAGELDRVDSDSAIVAHHLVVADKVVEVFSTIGDNRTDTVILMSTNHFAQGVSPIQTTLGSWETYYGEVRSDQGVIEDLMDEIETLSIEDETFEFEHGISTLVPFIARSFPGAKIVPLVIDESLSEEDRWNLVEAIDDHVDDAVVIASIDMSHFLPQTSSEFHDEITMRSIELGSVEDIELEIDSNATLDVLMQLNNEREDQVWNLTHHGSSLDMELSDDFAENTSHILGYFTEGESDIDQFASLHVVGDIMLDRAVRSLLESEGQDYPWLNMKRFLSGVHSRIGNLEGTVNDLMSTYTVDPPFRFVFSPESVEVMNEYIDVVSLANNHASDVGSAGLQETKDRLDEMDIPWFGSYETPVPRYDDSIGDIDLTYIGYHQFQPDEDELAAQIAAADAEGRFVVVFPHWGTEYQIAPSSSQRELAELMIDSSRFNCWRTSTCRTRNRNHRRCASSIFSWKFYFRSS